jgi:hypothetical protein
MTQSTSQLSLLETIKEGKMLTKEQLVNTVPALFSENPDSRVSERYSFLSTEKIINVMENEGWGIANANQKIPIKKYREERKSFCKHLIRFRKSDQQLIKDEYFPEIVLVNSHDRSSKFTFYAGIFRVACSNGLIVATSSFEKFVLTHIGFEQKEVIEITKEITRNVNKLFPVIEQMKSKIITKPEQIQLAREASKLRWQQNSPLLPDQLLQRRRQDDMNNDVWTVYNVIQENIIKGGLEVTTRIGTRSSSTKEIKNIDRNVKLNIALWNLFYKLI